MQDGQDVIQAKEVKPTDRLNFDQFRSSRIARLLWDTMLLYSFFVYFLFIYQAFSCKNSLGYLGYFFVRYLYIDR